MVLRMRVVGRTADGYLYFFPLAPVKNVPNKECECGPEGEFRIPWKYGAIKRWPTARFCPVIVIVTIHSYTVNCVVAI